MAMRRTTVFADEDDLAILKAAAFRLGVAEAELIREAIHLAAMANRIWTDPFFEKIFVPVNGTSASAAEVLQDIWTEKADAYELTKTHIR